MDCIECRFPAVNCICQLPSAEVGVSKTAGCSTQVTEMIVDLLEDVMGMHRDTDSPDYNECEKVGEECAW